MNKNDLADLLNLFELDKGFTPEDLKTSYRDLVQIGTQTALPKMID